MSETDTPRTLEIIDLLIEANHPETKDSDCERLSEEALSKIKNMEEELSAARAELADTQKDYKCPAELLDGHDATECRMNLVRLKEQRDRLANVLEKLRQCISETRGKDATLALIESDEALQSLTTNEQ